MLGQIKYKYVQVYIKDSNREVKYNEFMRTYLSCKQQNGYSDLLRVSDIVLLQNYFSELLDQDELSLEEEITSLI